MQHFYAFLDVLDRCFFFFFHMSWFYTPPVNSVCVCVLCQAVYSASVAEDIPINKGILTVAATDADSGSSADIQYSLFGIGVEDFYMDANTGKYGHYYKYVVYFQVSRLRLSHQVSCAQPPSWTERRPRATNSLLRQQTEAGCSAALTFH